MGKKYERKYYEYEGKMYTLWRLADIVGVNWGTLRDRVVVRGMSLDEAIALKYQTRNKEYDIDGVPMTITEMAVDLGLKYQTFYARANNKGMRVDELYKELKRNSS